MRGLFENVINMPLKVKLCRRLHFCFFGLAFRLLCSFSGSGGTECSTTTTFFIGFGFGFLALMFIFFQWLDNVFNYCFFGGRTECSTTITSPLLSCLVLFFWPVVGQSVLLLVQTHRLWTFVFFRQNLCKLQKKPWLKKSPKMINLATFQNL